MYLVFGRLASAPLSLLLPVTRYLVVVTCHFVLCLSLDVGRWTFKEGHSALFEWGLKAGNRLWTDAAGPGSIRNVIKPTSPLSEPLRADRGLTLAEVMLSMVILSFAALGLLRLNYTMTLTAEDNIHQNTAIVMAQGYLEQIKAQSFPTLQSIADDSSSSVQIQLTNHSGGIMGVSGVPALYNHGSFSETFNLDQDTAGNGTYPMTLQIQPVLTDLSTIAGMPSNSGVEITVTFTATYNLGKARTFTGSLSTVRANVRH